MFAMIRKICDQYVNTPGTGIFVFCSLLDLSAWGVEILHEKYIEWMSITLFASTADVIGKT